MHRQDDRRAQPAGDLRHAGMRQGEAAIDRDHDDVEPSDLGIMGVGQRVMQMAEMADAQARDLEDKDGIGVGDHAAIGPGADIGRDVADIDVVDHDMVLDRVRAFGVPSRQDDLDRRIGREGVVRGMGAVHGDDARHGHGAVEAGKVGRDGDARGRFDAIGRMAGEGDGDRIGHGERVFGGRGRSVDHVRQALARRRGTGSAVGPRRIPVRGRGRQERGRKGSRGRRRSARA